MGTNYYAREDCCKECGHSNNVVHIGKSSAGWTFSFHALYDIKSYREWLMFLNQKNVKIFSEYNDEISLKDFKDLVERKRKEKHNHAKEYPDNEHFLDSEENSFCGGDFS